MASSASGDQSFSLSLSSGRTTTRLSTDSPEEQGAMAMPSLIMADIGERIALTDGETVEASEDASTPMIIVVAATKPLSPSLVASCVMGANGSSESRGKSRSPPRAIADRLDRNSPNTPPSRGTRQSGVSLAPTPPSSSAHQSHGMVTLVTRHSSAASIRSDVLVG